MTSLYGDHITTRLYFLAKNGGCSSLSSVRPWLWVKYSYKWNKKSKTISCSNERGSCRREACDCDRTAAHCFANNPYRYEIITEPLNSKRL